MEAECIAEALTHGDLTPAQFEAFATTADHPTRMDAYIVAAFNCHSPTTGSTARHPT